MTETIEHSAFTLDDQPRSSREILKGMREPVWRSGPGAHELAAMLEALETAEAERTVLEDQRYRLRPLSEWPKGSGDLAICYAGDGGEGPMIGCPPLVESMGGGCRFWLPLPESSKLWLVRESC